MRHVSEPVPARRSQLLLSVAVIIVVSSGLIAPVEAQQDRERSTLKDSLQVKQGELQQRESKAESLTQDLELIRQHRQRLNKQLIDTGALIRKSESQLTAIEARVSELEAQKKLLKGSLDHRRASIAKLLSALQRMGRNPPPVMITERKDALRMVRSAMLIAAVFPEMRDQALELSKKLKDLVRVMTDIRQKGAQLKAESENLSTMRVRLSGLLAEKKQKITDRQKELRSVRTAVEKISKSVNDLNGLIAKLDQTIALNTTMASYQAKARERQLANSSAASAQLNTSPTDPQKTEKETQIAALRPAIRPSVPPMVELTPGVRSLVPGRADRIEPAMPFVQTRGKLPLPAHGKRILSYGEKTQYGGRSKGLVLETRPFGQIISPADGWIVYAGKFRSYGQLLIINAGDGYHILLAGLSRIDVEPGQFVLAAEPVGAMRGTPKRGQGSAQTIAQSNAPVLYVEFRKAGKPINPDPWWATNRLKVQG